MHCGIFINSIFGNATWIPEISDNVGSDNVQPSFLHIVQETDGWNTRAWVFTQEQDTWPPELDVIFSCVQHQ